MFRQDRQKASFYDARIWFPSFCYARGGTAQVMTTEVVKKNPKVYLAFYKSQDYRYKNFPSNS